MTYNIHRSHYDRVYLGCISREEAYEKEYQETDFKGNKKIIREFSPRRIFFDYETPDDTYPFLFDEEFLEENSITHWCYIHFPERPEEKSQNSSAGSTITLIKNGENITITSS